MSKGCFTPSVSTSVFNLAPSEQDSKLYAAASLLEIGTGIPGLSREGAGARGTILGVRGSECRDLHRTQRVVLPEELAVPTEICSASSGRMKCVAGSVVHEATKGLGDFLTREGAATATASKP